MRLFQFPHVSPASVLLVHPGKASENSGHIGSLINDRWVNVHEVGLFRETEMRVEGNPMKGIGAKESTV
jgi:hypothetical protein